MEQQIAAPETTLETTLADTSTRFGPGRPGNRTGQTARQRHAAELIEKFTSTHGRSPDVVERGTIANVAAMMAKSNARHGVSAEQLVRLSNSIDRLVARLGLAPKPPEKPKAPGGLGAILRGDRHG
jgi:hypothetical protein